MSAALQAMAAQLVNVALAIVLVAVWMGLSAYLDGKPTETDAAALVEVVSNDRAAEHAARKGPR